MDNGALEFWKENKDWILAIKNDEYVEEVKWNHYY
jgi:hypothetical protein